jgi:repressor of nif and glnA expression
MGKWKIKQLKGWVIKIIVISKAWLTQILKTKKRCCIQQLYVNTYVNQSESYSLEKSEIHTTKFAIAVWKYTIIMDNQNPFYFQ